MVQINMRVFKIISLFLTISSVSRLSQSSPVSSLRLEHRGASEDDSPLIPENLEPLEGTTPSKPEEDTYDQRQNGTENYRIHVDGLVLVVAPVEALLLAGGVPDNFSNFLNPPEKPVKPQEEEETLKPIIKPDEEENKPIEGENQPLEVKKTSHRGHLKLVSFLAPLLRHIGQH